MRLWFRLLAGLSPALADRHAARLFLSPRRRPKRRPLRIAGSEGTAFTVHSGGSSVACWSHGSGPMVLLVHGWDGLSHDWEQIAGALVAAGHRVVLVDLPAHGHSGGRWTTLPAIVCALRAVVERVLASPAGEREPLEAIVGHSFGGAAVALALRDGLPARKAVLIAPVADPSSFVHQVAAMLGLSSARTAGMAEQVQVAVGARFSDVDVPRAARHLATPALILHDRQDRAVPWEQGRSIADAWPGAQFVSTTELGHRGILRSPEIVARIIAFLGQEPAAGADQHPRSRVRQQRGAEQALHG